MITFATAARIVTDVEERTKRGNDYPIRARQAVLEAVLKQADSEEHLEAAAQHLIDTATWTPLAAEWLAALAATATPRPEGEISKALGCAQCDWTSWITVERNGHSWATECACRRTGTMSIRPADETPSAEQIQEQRKLVAAVARELAGGKS